MDKTISIRHLDIKEFQAEVAELEMQGYKPTRCNLIAVFSQDEKDSNMNAVELQSSIDTINAEIDLLCDNKIPIEDWENVGEWALKNIDWSKEEDKVYFRTKQIDTRGNP